jgi:hypothetical protein
VVNVGLTSASGVLSNDRRCRALGANKKNLVLLAGQTVYEIQGIIERWNRVFQVDDMDLVAGAEDVRGHFGVPEASLVTEVSAGLQQLTHGDLCHESFSSWVMASQQPQLPTHFSQ